VNKAEMREMARWYVSELGVGWLKNATSGQFDLDDMLWQGLQRYYRETKCSLVGYTLPATAGLGVYSYGAFGVELADTDLISVLAAANNTTAFTLVAGQPVSTYLDQHYITISLKNNTGGVSSGNAANYTIVGTLFGGEAYSEVVAFAEAELLNAADQAVVTKTSSKPFATITSITPSAAQPVGWQHSAGVGAQSAGSRIFDVSYIAYDENPLTRTNRHRLDRFDTKWRFASSGTPDFWLPWGEKMFRIWRPADSARNIFFEGWETPDATVFDADTDTPPIEATDGPLISMYAAILATVREPTDEMQIRQSILFPQVSAGWLRAYKRIHGTGDEEIIFARNASDSTCDDMPGYKQTITNI
jgi:hypothetical protein